MTRTAEETELVDALDAAFEAVHNSGSIDAEREALRRLVAACEPFRPEPQCRYCLRYPAGGPEHGDEGDTSLTDPAWDGDGDVCTLCYDVIADVDGWALSHDEKVRLVNGERSCGCLPSDNLGNGYCEHGEKVIDT